MSEWNSFDWFVTGLAIGYLWHPVWVALKTIWREARIASKEWNK
jgi:hypothetical protein